MRFDGPTSESGPLGAGVPETGSLEAGGAEVGPLGAGVAETGSLEAGGAEVGPLGAGVAETGSLEAGGAALAALQRRTLRVLVGAQILGALGTSAAAAGALLALDITGSESLSSLPLALLVVGSSATVMPISALSRRAGRRAGLAAALGVAALGAAGMVVAGVLESFALLLVASVAFGAGNTAIMLARYAAADLSTPAQRGRAIGRVVFATTLGGVAGPNLLAPAGDAATALGLPELTGLYAFAVLAFAAAGVVLLVLLRPDPLRVAAALDPEPVGPREPVSVPLRRLLGPPAAVTGLATVVTANFVMVAVMAMAPVHMEGQGHSLQLVGLVVSLHVAGMFAPSPITGWLTDRVGPLPVAQRPRVEGAGELSMGIAAASATSVAGPLVGVAGYATLALAGAVAAAALAPFLLAVARRGLPAKMAPANRMLS